MVAHGYKVIGPLMEALGLPADMPVRSLTLQADVVGQCVVTVRCFARGAEFDTLAPLMAEHKFVLVEADGPPRVEAPDAV